ncbi:hypothetical protein [Tractidigestivibacter scatoligenes]|jgi:hypothetical protein|uniref:hypothetical protein n=1 Tax=Tractidigestivibacter scatoligenes TaxID=1299998 RepID=UPI002F35D750
MSDEQLERELKALAKEVRLPNKVREGVECKARQMDGDAIVRTGTGRSVTRRNLLWGGAVSAGVAASLLGLAILGRNQQNDRGSLTESPSNPFVLRAYAEGMPQGDGSVLTTRFISTLGSWGTTDTGKWYASRDIDLTCMGDGIESIEYSLSGPNTSREEGQDATGQAIVRFDALYNGETGENESLPENNSTATSYVVTYDGQAADERAFNRTLYAEFPTDDALDTAEALSQQLSEINLSGPTWEDAVQQAEAYIALDRLLEKRSADLLASTTLTMTAHLQGGGVQSHAYSILLREDFDNILDEWLDSQVEPEAAIKCYRDDPDHTDDYADAQERLQYIYSQPPDLFVLTELEQK